MFLYIDIAQFPSPSTVYAPIALDILAIDLDLGCLTSKGEYTEYKLFSQKYNAGISFTTAKFKDS